MRYELEFEIDRPRDEVVNLFLDPDTLPRWQVDFVSFEPLGGPATRAVGEQAKLVHRMGGRNVETLETITIYAPPDHFAAIYETDGFINRMDNRFLATEGRGTKWLLSAECTASGIFMRLLTLFAPGLFKRQTALFMERFKSFAETGTAK